MQSDVRKKILAAFTESRDEFLSGQYLADLIGCSRTAVWKHIEELRKEGFELEAVRRKGYRIVKTPEKVSADEIRLGLKTEFMGQNIYYEETVDSTQKIAHRLSMENWSLQMNSCKEKEGSDAPGILPNIQACG